MKKQLLAFLMLSVLYSGNVVKCSYLLEYEDISDFEEFEKRDTYSFKDDKYIQTLSEFKKKYKKNTTEFKLQKKIFDILNNFRKVKTSKSKGLIKKKKKLTKEKIEILKEDVEKRLSDLIDKSVTIDNTEGDFSIDMSHKILFDKAKDVKDEIAKFSIGIVLYLEKNNNLPDKEKIENFDTKMLTKKEINQRVKTEIKDIKEGLKT